ncbi:uncharacterized protein BO88DRAFT_415837 [Aspergillus vadensis CBS 113365]|uniref:Uncharacterized protein n=1 Tax=Aspergillus vadensis (strain CBS 113365 / IMI 142717 / IBT 24658) TaxID=1448311 RepID=A0A319BZT1_ASPVC|nr:hypothetical protein BO88DRAFT_415837 [Aspergillus vadensis CBS 113365]PYH68678.1 hypothetical protein BO88DRAFT_415837 [Aspergillus vadensis CBS 113365]
MSGSLACLSTVYVGDRTHTYFIDSTGALAVFRGTPVITDNEEGPIRIIVKKKYIKPDPGTQIASISFPSPTVPDYIEVRVYYIKEGYLHEVSCDCSKTLNQCKELGSPRDMYGQMGTKWYITANAKGILAYEFCTNTLTVEHLGNSSILPLINCVDLLFSLSYNNTHGPRKICTNLINNMIAKKRKEKPGPRSPQSAIRPQTDVVASHIHHINGDPRNVAI